LRFGLPERALRTFNGKLKLACIELNEDLSGLDFLAEIGVDGSHGAVDFAADTNLIGGNQASG
jgi:hypothetical protein